MHPCLCHLRTYPGRWRPEEGTVGFQRWRGELFPPVSSWRDAEKHERPLRLCISKPHWKKVGPFSDSGSHYHLRGLKQPLKWFLSGGSIGTHILLLFRKCPWKLIKSGTVRSVHVSSRCGVRWLTSASTWVSVGSQSR